MPRPRKPTALKAIHGNPGKRQLNPTEPKPSAVAPPMPDLVSEDDAARAEWERIVPLLVGMGVVSELDLVVLTEYCLTWSESQDLRAQIKKRGYTVPTDGGGVKRNPLLPALNDIFARYRWACASLGLTPADRSRVNATPPPPEDPIDALKSRKKARSRQRRRKKN